MTYNVFGGTLNFAQSVSQSARYRLPLLAQSDAPCSAVSLR